MKFILPIFLLCFLLPYNVHACGDPSEKDEFSVTLEKHRKTEICTYVTLRFPSKIMTHLGERELDLVELTDSKNMIVRLEFSEYEDTKSTYLCLPEERISDYKIILSYALPQPENGRHFCSPTKIDVDNLKELLQAADDSKQ